MNKSSLISVCRTIVIINIFIKFMFCIVSFVLLTLGSSTFDNVGLFEDGEKIDFVK